MKITIGQFIGLVLIAAFVYYYISPWWGDQDQGGWINRFNNSIIEDGRVDTTKASRNQQSYDPTGWN